MGWRRLTTRGRSLMSPSHLLSSAQVGREGDGRACRCAARLPCDGMHAESQLLCVPTKARCAPAHFLADPLPTLFLNSQSAPPPPQTCPATCACGATCGATLLTWRPMHAATSITSGEQRALRQHRAQAGRPAGPEPVKSSMTTHASGAGPYQARFSTRVYPLTPTAFRQLRVCAE